MKIKYRIIYLFNKLVGNEYPCGRTKKNSYLCCMRPMTEKSVYYSSDRKKVFCKYCNSLKILSSSPIKSIDNVWE